MVLQSEIKKILEKQQYRFIGNHSLVKICYWTRQSLSKNIVCFKEKWYPPVESHRCMQITPYFGCNFHCLHCWRLHSGDRPNLIWKEFPLEETDEPSEIVEKAIDARKKLLSGFKGNLNVDKNKFEEALKPTMMTLSLTGESTLYSRISELILEAKKRKMITFLVTNGSMPEVLENFDALPWQLYVTLPAPNEKIFLKVCRPLISDGWKRINKTLELFSSLNCRTAIRLTLVKGLNMINPKGYAKLIEKTNADFVECKSYMHVGESQKRLSKEDMPSIEDIRQFTQKLSEHIGYTVKDEDTASRVVLLSKE